MSHHVRCVGDGHDLVRMKFKCRWCKAWVCGECEGTHDDLDPVGNRLCDPCWSRRAHRLTPQARERFGITIDVEAREAA